MRKYSALIISAIIGSALTIGVFLAINPGNNRDFKIEYLSDIPSKQAVYTTDKEGDIIPLDFTEASKDVMNAVVHIQSSQKIEQGGNMQYRQLPDPFRDFFDQFFGPGGVPQQQQQGDPRVRMGTGSGVIINPEGYIITNNHVIDKAHEIKVTLHDNRNYMAKVVGTDPATDLALIQIKEKGLPTIPLINSDDVEIGDWVLAVGNPFNLTSTVTAGIVSAKARNINILQDRYAIESFIQTDAAINPGNSGGALVNLQGGLVGINTAIASPTGAYSGYGFAVPSNIVNKVIEDIIEYGTVQRGYLGVTIRDITGDLAREEDLDVTEGVYIDSVLSESAADKAGIQPGDVVLSVEGTDVKQASELQEQIARRRPGDKVDITINRDGKKKNLTAKLKNRQGTTKTVTKEKSEILNILGAEFSTISEDKANQLNIDGGVKVTNLLPGKLRRETNIKEGFIITKVNDEKVKTAEKLIKILEKRKGGVMLEGIYENLPGKYYYAFGL